MRRNALWEDPHSSSGVAPSKHRHAIVDLRLDNACAFALLYKKSGVPGERNTAEKRLRMRGAQKRWRRV